MSLIDRLIEPTKDYISFKDFLLHLSGLNEQPVYEVATYLLHHDLSDIGFYHIDTDYKIIQANFDDKSITNFLSSIQLSLLFGAEDWIFHNGKSLEQLSDDVRRQITKFCYNNIHSFFKISDLLSFEPLNGLLHFDTTDSNQPKTHTIKHQELGGYQKLLVSYELFTPEQIVCLMIDENPACISHNDNFLAHWDKVSTAIDAGALTPTNDKQQMAAEQVKAWLAKGGLIYQGFNDNLPNDTDKIPAPTVAQTEPPNNDQLIKELTAAKAQITSLKSDLKQAKADNDQLRLQAGTPADIAIDEGQGDTLLILGAVMDCIKEVAKPNYTQQSLITAITDRYQSTSSLTQSTLSKKFPKAKSYLKQHVTP